MEYPVKTDGIYVSSTIFEESSEQTVDADFGLPDYCPDIQKILKCCIEPQIENKNIIGDRVDIEGFSIVRIIYIDAIKGSVRCTEQSYPFSISSNLKDTPQNGIIETDIKVSYLNCRALSPRRLNIHGAFNVFVKVIDRSEIRTCTHIQGDDIQQKKKTIDYSYLEAVSQQQFSITETLETGQSQAAIQSVIRTDIRAFCSECKPINNKIMYKGELLVKVMYLSDLDVGKIETMEYTIPFSRVIDINGVTESSECAVTTEVMNHTLTLRSEIGFDDPLPVLSVKLCLTAFSFEKRDTMVITDCYSTSCETTPVFSTYTLPLLCAEVKENVVEKTLVDLNDNSISQVIDVWVENGSVLCSQDDVRTALNGKFNICILAKDVDNGIIYTERVVEYNHPIQEIPQMSDMSMDIHSSCISVGFRICNEKRVEVRTELLVVGELYDTTTVSAVSSISADEKKKCQKDKNAALILYFASKGENVWTIAREHRTSVDRLLNENDLQDETLLESRMLMIPV